MKTVIAITAVTVALAGAAVASPNPSFELKGFGVDASSFDAATINRLNAAVHGSGTESEKALKVRAILQQVNG